MNTVTSAQNVPVSDPPLRSYRRAGWWRRCFAWILDAFTTAIPVSVIVTVAGVGSHEVVRVVHGKVVSSRTAVSVEAEIAEALLWLAAQAIYYGFGDGSQRGQTLGKRWMGIATVDLGDGGPIGFWRGAARGALMGTALCCFAVPGLVDALWPLWDPAGASLHDRATRSAVIEVMGS